LDDPTPTTVMSFGGGIQSTAIAHMVINRHPELMRVVDGLPDLFVFADTGDEPKSVYESVIRTKKALHPIPLMVVKKKSKWGGSISEDLLNRMKASRISGGDMPPMFVKNPDGTQGNVHRQCTFQWKIRIIHRAIKKAAGLNLKKPSHRNAGRVVNQWLGISTNEIQRMRDPKEDWLKHTYPLIDMGWDRANCISYLEKIGVGASRSACVHCPYQSNAEWIRLKQEEPDEWDKAVEFEKKIHEAMHSGAVVCGLKNLPYLHNSMVPLDEADFNRQGDLFAFDNECAGVCGV